MVSSKAIIYLSEFYKNDTLTQIQLIWLWRGCKCTDKDDKEQCERPPKKFELGLGLSVVIWVNVLSNNWNNSCLVSFFHFLFPVLLDIFFPCEKKLTEIFLYHQASLSYIHFQAFSSCLIYEERILVQNSFFSKIIGWTTDVT